MEALDFIVNVLKEHEKDLDKLINELATVTEQLGDTGEISGKVEKVEEKITSLQKEVANLMNYISGVPRTELPITAKEPKEPMETSHASSMVPIQTGGPSVIFRCMQWEDFQNFASQAQALSFCYKEEDKTFQADALSGNRVVTYSGALPKFNQILKAWLSKELNVDQKNILEGVLAIG